MTVVIASSRLATLVCSALLGALVLAGQPRSVSDGVYSAAQARRGEQLYTAQCAQCHGKAMEGSSGPPLAGEHFLANWSSQPLSTVLDKIQKTMPFGRAGSLSRGQASDLTAYILETGKFRAGSAELSEAALAQTVFPAVTIPAAPVAAGGMLSLTPPEGNLAELMRAIAFPNSNIIFNVQIKNPGDSPKKLANTIPFDYVEWGSTIYPGWLAIDQAAIALTETAPLLLTPGRKCQNGRPVPTDRADWKKWVSELADVGRLAHRASQARDFDAFVDISEKLNEACANCHRAYRDRGGPEGSGGTRCQPPPERK